VSPPPLALALTVSPLLGKLPALSLRLCAITLTGRSAQTLRAPVETSKFRTQMEVKGASIFRPKKLEQVSMSQLLSFSAQPIKASLVQLLPEASKQAVEMFQLVMK
jgi:hypothetical protein